MPFDAHRNLAIATVVTAPSPAASGTSVVVGAGQGARFPAVPFNGTVWPFDMAPDPATAEVWRCTAIAGDTLTLVRAQEGTTARAMVAGDLIAATITAKSLTDIESGVNFPLITTGAVSGTTGSFSGTVTAPTFNGAVTGGAISGTTGTFSGTVSSPAHSGGTVSGTTGTFTGALSGTTGTFTGTVTTPGVDLTAGARTIRVATNDGADTGSLALLGAGAADPTRGAYVVLAGNESATPGAHQIVAGNVAAGAIEFYTGPTALRGKMHNSGGCSWGSAYDPGVGSFMVGIGPFGYGNQYVKIGAYIESGQTGTGGYHIAFQNASTLVGSITTSSATTAYNTTSDARLKTPLSRHTDTEVLRNTVIHNFVWKSDGTAGRGVFAQEAVTVLPAAVSVGGDERDSGGNLTRPWGVDYSKYVPDLITGWQAHDQAMDLLAARLVFLEGAVTSIRAAAPIPRMTLWQRVRNVGNFITGFFPAWITP